MACLQFRDVQNTACLIDRYVMDMVVMLWVSHNLCNSVSFLIHLSLVQHYMTVIYVEWLFCQLWKVLLQLCKRIMPLVLAVSRRIQTLIFAVTLQQYQWGA